MPDPYFQAQGVRIFHGDCLDVLTELDTEFTATVTDPPYGLSFMGRNWDHGVPGEPFWEAVRDSMAPGAPLLAFGGTRKFHRLWCCIEDAGFEIRDTLSYMYGTGFPKSHDISKAIDDAKGAEREVVKENPNKRSEEAEKRTEGLTQSGRTTHPPITAPATDEAETWSGQGTSLKPAWEPICLAFNPREGTYVENALEHGVAGLNIDAVRVDTDEDTSRPNGTHFSAGDNGGAHRTGRSGGHHKGRWPPNAIFDERAAALLDEQTGVMESRGNVNQSYSGGGTGNSVSPGERHKSDHHDRDVLDQDGGASRFFYTSKASSDDRTKGMPDGAENPHPTVKPTDLIGWLCKLASYPGENHYLDPFAGSGPLAYVAAELGHKATLIEQDEENAELCAKRLQGQQSLFSA